MPVSALDLEVFVLTYNRANLLRSTLESLVEQTVQGARIVVLDNGSTDDTSKVVAAFAACGIKYVRSGNNEGSVRNFRKAQALASLAWVMVFHDDDLIHPGYFAAVLAAINSHPEVALVASGMSFEESPSREKWADFSTDETLYCSDAGSLAGLLYDGFPLHFGSAVYRKEAFQKTPLQDELYGKIADRPFLIEAAASGGAVVLQGAYIQYRCHPGQDSAAFENGPFIPQIVELNRFYRLTLGASLFSSTGRVFLKRVYRRLRDEQIGLSRKEDFLFSRTSYVKYMAKQSGISYSSIAISIFFTYIYIELGRLIHNFLRRMFRWQ
jgi:glycosyltransferase involved in cell wall biosynthesis